MQNKNTPILFGTDGWRAVIGADYTYDNVRRVIQAFCELHAADKKRGVYVGYDRRFASERFAQVVASVLGQHGFRTYLSDGFCPTPAISWMVQKHKALAGIVVTASHNPYFWNGLKFKQSDGGSASVAWTQKLEKQILKNPAAHFEELPLLNSKVSHFSSQEYLSAFERLVDLKAIRRSKIKFLVDPMHGAGSGFLPQLFPKQAHEIRGEWNPGFGGVNPEPIAKNLQLTIQKVRELKPDIAIAFDGDADRVGAIDEKGNFVSSQQIFSVILWHLLTVKKWSGRVVKSIALTERIHHLAKNFGFPVVEVPIGFKHISEEFRKGEVLMGGEESGGIGFPKHVLERDGILSGLFLLEILAYHQKPFSKILSAMEKCSGGPCYYLREDLLLSPKIKLEKIHARLQNIPKKLGKYPVVSVNTLDGLKLFFGENTWLLLRASGTEPLIRVYAESPELRLTQELIELGKELVTK